MKGGVDRGVRFSYWRLSYRRKLIRTLWLGVVGLSVLWVIHTTTRRISIAVLEGLVAMFIIQLVYNCWRWRCEVASGDGSPN